MPAAAQRLRLPVWQRSQARLRDRYGFDLGASDSLERARSLVAQQPADPERVLLLAAALTMSGDDDLAEHQARRALDLAPDLARAHTTLAALLIRRDGREEALIHARRAAELDGGDPSILFNLGVAEWFAGDRGAARAAFGRAEEVLAGARPRGAPDHARRRWWPIGRRA